MGVPICEKREDSRTDLELGYLTLEGARRDALAEQLEAMHLGLDETTTVIAAPLSEIGYKPAAAFGVISFVHFFHEVLFKKGC